MTKEAVQEIIGEFSNLHSDRPIEEGEFDRAKEGILKGMPSNFETISQMMSSLVGMAAHDLQDDYFHQSLEKENGEMIGVIISHCQHQASLDTYGSDLKKKFRFRILNL